MGFFQSLMGKNDWDKLDDQVTKQLRKNLPMALWAALLDVPSVNNHKFEDLLETIKNSSVNLETKIQAFADLCYENGCFLIDYKVIYGQDQRLKDAATLFHVSIALKPNNNLSHAVIAIILAQGGINEARERALLGLEAIQNTKQKLLYSTSRKAVEKLGYLTGLEQRLKKLLKSKHDLLKFYFGTFSQSFKNLLFQQWLQQAFEFWEILYDHFPNFIVVNIEINMNQAVASIGYDFPRYF